MWHLENVCILCFVMQSVFPSLLLFYYVQSRHFSKRADLKKLVIFVPVNSQRFTSLSVQRGLHVLQQFSMYVLLCY